MIYGREGTRLVKPHTNPPIIKCCRVDEFIHQKRTFGRLRQTEHCTPTMHDYS